MNPTVWFHKSSCVTAPRRAYPKQALFSWAFVLSAALLAGCSSGKSNNVERGTREQVLYYANGDEPKSLDPHLTTGSPDNNVIMNLLEGLVIKDPATLEPRPGVAESWTVSEDGRTYRFTLRESARWSNGDPVTAQDFVFSWRRALTPSLPNEYAYMMFYLQGAEEFYTGATKSFDDVAVKALSQRVLEVTLKNPVHFFLQLLDHHSFYPVHEATILAHGAVDDPGNKWILPGNFVGNGAFVLKRWEVNKVIEIAKNEHYWNAANVRLNGAHFFPIEDQQAEERAFRSGQVHLTNTPQMDIEKIAVYKKERPEELRVFPTYSSYYYMFNLNKKPLDDVRVRRAISMAIDRQMIVENVTKGGEIPAFSLIPKDPEGYSPESYFTYDVPAAQKLLAEAGYPNGEGFPVFSVLFNTHDNHQKVALAIQQMLKKNLNIDIQLQNNEWKVYMDARRNMEHDIARAGWLADYVDASNFFDVMLSHSGNNHTAWVNEEYDSLVAASSATTDTAERYVLFEKANRILADEMPIIPLYYYADLNMVSTDVKNWHDNVMHYHPLRDVYLESSTAD